MYILSNGVKITEEIHQRLCQAIKDTSKRYVYFLDMEIGKLIRISHTKPRKLAVIQKESQRFIPLPKASKEERRKRFVALVEELGVIDVPRLQNRLSKKIKKGALIDELEKILEDDPSGWIHGWVQDEQFLLAEKIEEWITEPPLSAKDDPDYWYDDDCPVCQLIRKMEEENRTPTLNETHEAFKKSKEQGGWVGGELFEGPKDQIDREVDEMLEMAKSKKFEPGIYNFCDRWCEKCKNTEKCFLYAQERQGKSRNMMKGKNDNDWLIDVKHNFKITKRLIERSLEKEGIGPQKVLEKKAKKYWDDDTDKRYDKVQCLIRAREYMREVANFLDNFHQSRFQFYPELGMEIDFSNIKEEIETISWYHTLLPIKIWRFLYEKECLEKEKDKESRELMAKDLDKYYSLVKKCINKSKIVWQNLVKKRSELSSASSQFIDMLNKIKNEFSNKRN